MITLSSGHAVTRHPPESVFGMWADPTTWPDWDPDLAWVRFSGPMKVGARGRLKPVSGPSMAFIVGEYVHGRRFTDTGRLPGAKLAFDHRVSGARDGSEVEVTITLSGALAGLWNRLMGPSLRDVAQSSLDGLVRHLDRQR